MAKVVGTIQLTPQPGFPKLTGSDGDETITMKYRCTEEELPALPQYGDTYDFAGVTGNTLETRNIERHSSGEFYDVVLTYKAPPSEMKSVPSGPVMEEWDYETQDYDVPIEQHENYLTCWNHRFIVIKGEVENIELWSTATNTELDEDQSAKYAWIKPGDKVPSGWYEQHAEYKPGVESYRAGITTVNCVKRCTDVKKLIADAIKDYTIQTPAKTYGRTGEWLRGGSKIKKEGRYHVLTVSYLNIQEIDRDIYHV